MSFRTRLTAVMAAMALTVQGCGLNLGEKPAATKPPSYSGNGYSCVGQIPLHLEKFAADELDEPAITSFVRCLQRAFTSFTQLTRGRDQSVYTPEEIRRFLHTYFLKERPITDRMLREFMVLKQVVVGGEIDRITRPELGQLIEILEDFRVEAIRLKPHIKFLNPRLVVNQDPRTLGESLQLANETLKDSIRVFSSRLQKGTRDYPFHNLRVLIEEFRAFVRWDEFFADAHPAAYWVNFLKAFKRVTVSPVNPDVMGPREWAPFLESMAGWYLVFIEYRVGVRDHAKLQGTGLQNTIHLAQEIFKLLEDAISRQPGRSGAKALSIDDLVAVVSAGQDLKWVNPRVRAESVRRVLQALFGRVFSDEKTAAAKPPQPEGLTLRSLARMRMEFHRWSDLQSQINIQYGAGDPGKADPAAKVPSLQVSVFMPAEVRAKVNHDADWSHFIQVRELIRPLFSDDLTRITLLASNQLKGFRAKYEFSNLSMMNLFSSATDLLFRGYASERGRGDWASGIQSHELQEFYEDVRDLAIDLGLADRRVLNTGARAFIEGNLFTYSAMGLDADVTKSRLTYVETMELLAFLYSGGRMATDIFWHLNPPASGGASVCPRGPLDQNDEPTFSRACVKANMASLVRQFAPNLTGLVRYLGAATTQKVDLLQSNIVDTAFSPRTSMADWVQHSELSIMAVVLHYLEAVFTRYDLNQDGLLTNQEIHEAVPVFRGYIQRFAKEQMKLNLSEREAHGVFLYILKYKTIPSRWNLLKIYDLSFNLFWEFELAGLRVRVDLNEPMAIDRAELSSVFKAIVSKIFETAAKPNNNKD